ncbi:MAG TPA: hypothetical protein VLS93_16570 [Anaeromyxobacteraceae bacterium]|nr:hypothetical protein [Anaeromyxobacteraceae bacterium]
MRRTALVLPLLLLAACAPALQLSDADRERAAAELSGKSLFLRVAVNAAPFFGDRSRVFLTDQPLAEVDLLLTPGGGRIDPPAAERILPPGTPVRVGAVEFPTGWVIAGRVVMTPRYHPWVLLQVTGDERPHVIVLSQTAATFEDVRAEVDRLLGPDDPTALLKSLPAEQRDAILRKEPLEGMDSRALEMAWGQPERKRIDRPARTEEWTWPGGKRRAFLEDGRLVRWQK